MNTAKHIILFDGECNFCSFWVKYVCKRDPKRWFCFTPLKGEKGQRYLKEFGVDEHTDSVVLIEGSKHYMKSTAAFRILKTLGGWPSIFYVFILVPPFIRNLMYDVMAKYRYRFFGQGHCELPLDPNFKDRFL